MAMAQNNMSFDETEDKDETYEKMESEKNKKESKDNFQVTDEDLFLDMDMPDS